MLLLVIAGFLLALGLQLRARPFEQAAAGYYLGADDVVSLSCWKVIEPCPQRRSAAPALQPASPVRPSSPVRPWGEPEPVRARAPLRLGWAPVNPTSVTETPEVPAQASAAPAESAAPSRAIEPIILPTEVLAEIEASHPAPWARKPIVQELDEPMLDPAFAWFAQAPPHSLSLH
jgi:hypothetical protein